MNDEFAIPAVTADPLPDHPEPGAPRLASFFERRHERLAVA